MADADEIAEYHSHTILNAISAAADFKVFYRLSFNGGAIQARAYKKAFARNNYTIQYAISENHIRKFDFFGVLLESHAHMPS